MINKSFIILAEDDKFLGNIYKTKLLEEGFDVLVVENGEEAMHALRARLPNLLVLDIIMPVKDGFQVLKDIKEDKALQGVKILVLSNLAQDEDRQRAIELGAHAFVVKVSTSLHDVVEQIKRTLQ